jgi:hypothetical protein
MTWRETAFLRYPCGALLLITSGCGRVGSSSSGTPPDAGEDGVFDAPHDSVSAEAGRDATLDSASRDAGAPMCMVTNCYGQTVELPLDGAFVNVGVEGGGAAYCPRLCGDSGLCHGPSDTDSAYSYGEAGCLCQCVQIEIDPPSPICGAWPSTAGCFCGDAGIALSSTGGPISCN